MINDYLIIGDTQYPMLPDSTEEELDSRVWNVHRGDELIGIITSNVFQPVTMGFEKFEGMKVYHYAREEEDGKKIDIYALANHNEEVSEYDASSDNENILTENIYIQEAEPSQRIMEEAAAHQKVAEEKHFQSNIIQEATTAPPLIDTLRELHNSVHEITAIFGKSISDVIEFLQEEGEIVGMDSMIAIHEENNQRCIVMHESDEHRTERERVEEELRQEALGKLSKEEKRALGLK